MAKININALVQKLANRDSSRTEADVQSDLATLFTAGPFSLAQNDIRLETQVTGQRRIDVEVGLTVVETKRDLRPKGVLGDAIEQLAGYVQDRTEKLAQRYVGILTDGADWRLFHLEPTGELLEVSRFQTTTSSTADGLLAWLGAVMATEDQLSPTPNEVERRLGSASPTHALDIAALRDLWAAGSKDTEVLLKRELWARLLTTALGSSFDDSDELFLAHTYLVLVADVIAHEVVGIPTAGMNSVALVSGDRFTESGVFGVVEADFFAWVVDVPGGAEFVNDVARRVSRFAWAQVDHDVLKHLYESVIDPQTRKKLGEYYTPDWLAEAVVETTISEPLAQRVADPSCGSGTFVFHAVRRYLAAADDAGIDNEAAIDGVTRNVVGQDLHPVAVALARTTYLLAIGADRLAAERSDVHVPVYLGDTLQWQFDHSVLPRDGAGVTINVDDDAGLFQEQLEYPEAAMTDPLAFDRLVNTLTDKATKRARGSKVPSIKQILVPLGLNRRDEQMLRETFALMCQLHDQHRNHVWGYYTRNLVRPMWMARSDGKVDVLIGNPPWLAYSEMTAAMQQAFKIRCEERSLWVGLKVATKQDLSGYFVARASELYLRPGGKFAFVMPHATLSRQAYAPFRTGRLGINRLAFEIPWDLDGIKPAPFPVPSAVVFGTFAGSGIDASAVPLPDLVEAWSGSVTKTGGWSWDAVRPKVIRLPEALTQVDSDDVKLSHYGEKFRQGATIVPRVLHIVEPAPKVGGLGLAKGVVRVRSARTSQEKSPWKDLPDREATVEERFVFNLALGSSIAPFRVLSSEQCVIPWNGETLLQSTSNKLARWPHLNNWVSETEGLWEAHRSTKSRSMTSLDRLNYQRTLSAQFPISTSRVVYSASGNTLAAAIIEDDKTIIEHKLYWAAFASTDEAKFVCAILNAPETTRRVGPLQSRGLFGARDFDMYVWYLNIPEYDAADDSHRRVVECYDEAVAVAANVDVDPPAAFTVARGAIRSALDAAGLSDELDVLVSGFLDREVADVAVS